MKIQTLHSGRYMPPLPPTPRPERFQTMEIFSQSSWFFYKFCFLKYKNIFRWWCKIFSVDDAKIFSLLSALSVGGNNCSLGVIIIVSERCKCCLITTPGLRSTPPSPAPITTSSISPLLSSHPFIFLAILPAAALLCLTAKIPEKKECLNVSITLHLSSKLSHFFPISDFKLLSSQF